jgi:uncharacterized protein
MSDGSPVHDKLDVLRQIVRDCGSLLIAYSGSAGSALVAGIAAQELASNALACIGVSPSLRTRDLDDAIELAAKLGVRCRLVQTQELLDRRYAANPVNRCYYCKSELHHRLREVAQLEGWAVVADGNCIDIDGAHHDGLAAARQHAVRSPLIEAGFTSSEVLEAARSLGMPLRHRPALSCLSSRVRHGVQITAELLRQIEIAEQQVAQVAQRELVELRVRGELTGHHPQLHDATIT